MRVELAEMVMGLARGVGGRTRSDRGGQRVARMVRRLWPKGRRVVWCSLPGGRRLQLNLDRHPDDCMALAWYEKSVERELRSRLRPGGWFVDGGAYVGYFTTLAARLVGAGGRVDAFEPIPATFDRLRLNVQASGVAGWVRLHEAALLDRADEITLQLGHDRDANPAAASLFAHGGRAVAARSVRLDDVLGGRVPDLIKLDMEGSESQALFGMRKTLSAEKPPAILMEYNPEALRAGRIDPPTVLQEFIARHPRYRVFRVGGRLDPIDPAGPELAATEGFNVLLTAG